MELKDISSLKGQKGLGREGVKKEAYTTMPRMNGNAGDATRVVKILLQS